MARHWFGGSPADYAVTPGDPVSPTEETTGYTAILASGARYWAYDASTGTRVTDLLDDTGQMITEIVTGAYGQITRFRGPDEARALLLGQADDDPEAPAPVDRWLITSTDWPAIVSALDTRVTALENGGGGGDPGEVIATAHPMIWSVNGVVDDDTVSDHPYWNMEGKGQIVTTIRAQAAVTAGSLTCTVYTIDPLTQATTPIGAVVLNTTTQAATISPAAAVSDGTGVTVGVERASTADDIANVTVQVMIR